MPVAQIVKKLYLTLGKELLREPVICDMYDHTRVRFNLRQASISDEVGIVSIELCGDEAKVQEALDYLRSRGVRVEPIELNVIE